jgi:hypothetical protein
MRSKTSWRVVHITVVTLVIGTDVLAQAPMGSQFSGVILDYSPATTVTPWGPWEMRGLWTLALNADSSTADCALSNANPFDYLAELQKHPTELVSNPSAWMPWNYSAPLARVGLS